VKERREPLVSAFHASPPRAQLCPADVDVLPCPAVPGKTPGDSVTVTFAGRAPTFLEAAG
jgi:hypothetical protein